MTFENLLKPKELAHQCDSNTISVEWGRPFVSPESKYEVSRIMTSQSGFLRHPPLPLHEKLPNFTGSSQISRASKGNGIRYPAI